MCAYHAGFERPLSIRRPGHSVYIPIFSRDNDDTHTHTHTHPSARASFSPDVHKGYSDTVHIIGKGIEIAISSRNVDGSGMHILKYSRVCIETATVHYVFSYGHISENGLRFHVSPAPCQYDYQLCNITIPKARVRPASLVVLMSV